MGHEEHEPELNGSDADTAKLEHDLQKLNALQYLLDEDAFEELNHEVSVIKQDQNVSANDNSFAGLVKRKGSSINLRLKEFQEALRDNRLVDRGRKLRTLVDDKKLRDLIRSKKKQLDEKFLHPRFVDRCAFFIGILVLCCTEFFLLRCPELMYVWYAILIFPLMATRFFMYHKMKFHYFMLDFCYLCQFLLLFFLFWHLQLFEPSTTSALFKLVFCFSNGPLAWGTIIWKNKLVFHDVDKLTSVFIHLCPPLVTYCLRWHTSPPHHPLFSYTVSPPSLFSLSAFSNSNSSSLFFSSPSTSPSTTTPEVFENDAITIAESLYAPMIIYMFWQVAYFMKTEMIDRKKLANDKEIMTSSRWMTMKEPHPVYKWAVKKGYKGNGVVLLMGVQLVYTALTLIFLPLLYNNYHLHTFFLGFVFFSVLWGGASYYFETFTESYNKRLERAKHPVAGRKVQSFTSSILFFTLFLTSLFGLLKLII